MGVVSFYSLGTGQGPNRVPRVLLPAAFGGRSFVSFRTTASVHVRAAYSVVLDALFVSVLRYAVAGPTATQAIPLSGLLA